MALLNSLRCFAIALVTSLITSAAMAQTVSSRHVSLVVPYPPGGTADYAARLIQPEYQNLLGNTLIVDNVPGAGGSLGVRKVLAAQADSHIQLLGTPMDVILPPLALTAAKFQPEELRLAAKITTTSIVMLVRKDIPANNVDEFLVWAKGRKVSYASVGHGSMFHLVGAKFAQATGLDMLHVPYKGGNQVLSDLLGGQIDMAFWTLGGPVLGMLKNGGMKAIGIAQPQPHALLPNVLPMSKNKLFHDFTFELWAAVMVAKTTPEPVVALLNKKLNQLVENPAIRKSILDTAGEPAKAMSLPELDSYYASEIERYRKLAKSINLEPQ